ncbi:MAG: hypothetical protein V7607_2563 [Solirubrobacteraceae bacterium]
MAEALEQRIALVLVEFVAPLRTAAQTPAGMQAYLDRIGWEAAGAGGLQAALPAATEAVEAAEALATAAGADEPDMLAIVGAILRLGVAIGRVGEALQGWRAPAIDGALSERLAGELAADVLGSLADDWLRTRAGLVRTALIAAGLITLDATDELAAGTTVLRRPGRRLAGHFDQLGRWMTDPAGAARSLVDTTGAQGASGPGLAVAAWSIVGPELAGALTAAGMRTLWRPADSASLTPGTLWLFTSDDFIAAGRAKPPAWVVAAVEELGGTVALHLVPAGTWSVGGRAGDWRAALDVTATGAITVTSQAVTATADATAELTVDSLTEPAVLFGPADGPHLQIGALAVGAALALRDGQAPDIQLALDVSGLSVGLGPGGSDSFIGRILSAVGAADLSLGLRWSPRDGLRVTGGLDRFSILLAARVALGPVEVRQLTLATTLAADATDLALSGEITASLGPLFCRVEGLGLQLRLTQGDGALGVAGVRAGLKPPTGIGMEVDAGPVSGGGYLFFDADRGEYAGVLELSFAVLDLKAIGLLTTKLPDGRPGFSLLIIITAEFAPIQLGFGFALTGVGGLLGINRTMNVDALRDGVRNRTLDSILFPVDPVRNAPQVIANLRSVFPPAEGRYTLGPMVKLAWGPTSILEFEAAVILELPAPLRLAILGRLTASLPDKRAPVAKLSLHVVGVLDFDRGEVSVDASLFDSRIAAFPIAGDMAFRMGWKANKTFAIAAGGFHPRFPVPPGFPALRRLSISLAEGDNPRLRVTAYFALTSTSVQFGGGIDLYAALDTFLGTFSVAARASIDALIGEPFGFLLDLCIAVDIALNDTPLLHAQLNVSLEGATPWRAYGSAEISILFFKGHVAFDKTFGEADKPQVPTVALWPLLDAALGSDDAWSADRPAAGASDVSLRTPPGDERVLVHPLGRFTVRQRTLPLQTTISRFGAAVPAGQETRFAISALTVGTVYTEHPPAVTEDYAIPQFVDMPDDQRLSRPAFEPLPAGARGATPGHRFPVAAAGTAIAVDADPIYDDAVIDAMADATMRRRRDTAIAPVSSQDPLAALLDGGAAARAPRRRAEDPRAGGPDHAIAVVHEAYVASPLDHLDADGDATTYTQAAERRRPDEQVVTAAEVAG